MKEKIYYFQEKSNDILDLQDEFTVEEIGIYFILKAAYFKYAGELKEENLCQRCKFFGHKENLNYVKNKIFELKEGLLVNNAWLSEINEIKQRSQKRRLAAFEKWEKERSKKEAKEKQKVINLADSDNKNNKSKEAEFEEFWQAYNPVKTKDGRIVDKGSKKLAKVAYEKALQKYTADQIFEGTQDYLLDCYNNNRLTCQASVMLNQERFIIEKYQTLDVK